MAGYKTVLCLPYFLAPDKTQALAHTSTSKVWTSLAKFCTRLYAFGRYFAHGSTHFLTTRKVLVIHGVDLVSLNCSDVCVTTPFLFPYCVCAWLEKEIAKEMAPL